jgi:hypothetical protein
MVAMAVRKENIIRADLVCLHIFGQFIVGDEGVEKYFFTPYLHLETGMSETGQLHKNRFMRKVSKIRL